MISKNKSKQINSLKLKKYRDKHNLFVVEGTKLVFELIKMSKSTIIDVFCTERWINQFSDKFPQNINFELISENELKKISSFKTQEGVLAISRIKKHDFNTTFIENKLSIALDNIQDPGNLGTIIRTADWFGINTILCSKNTVDLYNPKVIQSTMGAIFRTSIFYVDLEQIFTNIKDKINIYGTYLKGENIYNLELTKNGIILIGNESKGISDNFMSYVNKKIFIPNFSNNQTKTESLNAAIATSIICSEFRRRK